MPGQYKKYEDEYQTDEIVDMDISKFGRSQEEVEVLSISMKQVFQ